MTRDLTADACVLGSGPAGLIVATRLAQAGRSVVLVEQGPRYPDTVHQDLSAKRIATVDWFDFGQDWPEDFKSPQPVSSAKTEGHDYRYARAIGVGGSSLHWSGHTPRPVEDDFRTRKAYGIGRDWPIQYAELEPWLLRAEDVLGVSADDDNPYTSPRSGPFPMPAHPFSHFERTVLAPACKKLGWTAHSRANAINSVSRGGRSGCLACRACSVCPSGARFAADVVVLPEFLRQKGATLTSETKLRRLEVSADGRRIVAAHTVSASDRSQGVIKAEQFILALGGVETPRMLLLSRDDKHYPDGIGNRTGQVGTGFTDHVMSMFTLLTKEPVGHSLGFPAMNCEHYRKDVDRSTQGTFSINLLPAPAEWDFLIPTTDRMKRATSGNRLSLAALRDSLRRGVLAYTVHELEDAGQLSLDENERDAFGDPLPKVHLELTEWERASLDSGRRAMASLVDTIGAELWSMWDDKGVWWAAHPSGGAAMAATEKAGVCDADLKVWGLDNLHLLGSCVFPHQGAANPTLTIVALALRLAQHLGAAR